MLQLRVIEIVFISLLSLALASCRSERFSSDPTLQLSFSEDTVSFDTIFTSIGSSTQCVMIRNANSNALRISRIWKENSDSPFSLIVDGETDLSKVNDWTIYGGDSLYLFVRVTIDPNQEDAPFLVEDNICLQVGENIQSIHLEAYGENAHMIRTDAGLTYFSGNYTFLSDLPYLIYDTVVVAGRLTIEPGARLYFHKGALLQAQGNVTAMGTEEKPIVLMGDRRDWLFENVPYSYAAGMWDGVYFIQPELCPALQYQLSHVHIISANIGLYIASAGKQHSTLTMEHCRIHNHALYGLVLSNAEADIRYTEVSNAAAYCIYLQGGNYSIDYTTVASYFNNTNVRIQSTPRQDVAAIYVDNLNKNADPTELHLTNSVVVALRDNPIVVATPLSQFYHGTIEHSYVHADTANIFRNTYYEYKKYDYYDFRLDSLSPARFAALDSTDAGCYPFEPYQ